MTTRREDDDTHGEGEPGRGEHALAEDGHRRVPRLARPRVPPRRHRRASRQPLPATATIALSVTVSSRSCQRRAPYHVRRRRAASRSRRMLRAASTANANSSAAASPPTSSSRRPATVARSLDGPKLLDRRLHAVADRLRPDSAARARSLLPHEIVDLPQPSGGPPREATPTRSSDRCSRWPAPASAPRFPPRRRVAPAAAGGTSLPAGEPAPASRSSSALSVGARKSPKSWLERSVAGPDLDEPQPGRVRQRARAAHAQDLAARRRASARQPPAREADVRARAPSTPARETKWPATVLSRKRTIGVGPGRPMLRRASSARSSRSRGTPAPHRPERRTTRREPSATRPGCARPPARRSCPARSSYPRARRSGRPSRSRCRRRREERTRRPTAHSAESQSNDVEGGSHAVARRRR